MWLYKGEYISKIPTDAVGFVYKIHRLNYHEIDKIKEPVFYIGKKLFHKKTKSADKESDWLDYYGSSDEIQEAVKKYGKEN